MGNTDDEDAADDWCRCRPCRLLGFVFYASSFSRLKRTECRRREVQEVKKVDSGILPPLASSLLDMAETSAGSNPCVILEHGAYTPEGIHMLTALDGVHTCI